MRTFTVAVYEHDRWSGVSLAYRKSFRHMSSAKRFIKRIHSENNKDYVPDTYYTAKYEWDHIQYIRKDWCDGKVAGYEGPGWYFWDETQSNCYGPYKTANGAARAKNKYCHEVLGQ
jgi:hypothetical protein